MRMPSWAVQCESFSFAFLTASAYCSLVILARLLICTSPCQLVRSLPLKRAVKPAGGMLSLGPAFSVFSPALVQLVASPSTTARLASANHRCIVLSFRSNEVALATRLLRGLGSPFGHNIQVDIVSCRLAIVNFRLKFPCCAL